MSLRSLSKRVIISYARPEDYVEKTVAILGRLGYQIIAAEDKAAAVGVEALPDMLIVDERRLSELPEHATEGGPPIILLTGRKGVTHDRPSIVGAIKRPAGLHDLYRLTQQVFEEHPRSTPRVATDLRARCGGEEDGAEGALLSISENGGLLRCDRRFPLGSCFDLSFELPGRGAVALRAEAAYQLLPDLGVVFSGLEPSARSAIGDFVADTILA